MNLSRKKSAGFTLVEIIVGFILIGIITGFVVYKYIQLQMGLNMTIVEQHLRVIGEQLIQINIQNKKFPEHIFDPKLLSESSGMASSLEALEKKKGYQIEGYWISEGGSSYNLRTCPKKEKWGVSGDHCFVLDPSGVRRVNPWDGTAMAMNLFAKNVRENAESVSGFSGVLTPFLKNLELTNQEKSNLLANQFEKTAYRLDLKQHQIEDQTCPISENESCAGIKLADGPISTLFYFPRNQNFAYQELLAETYKKLSKKGIYLVEREITLEEIAKRNKNTQWSLDGDLPTSYLANHPDMKAIEVGFLLKNPVETDDELRKRTRSVGKTVEDWQFA